MAGNWIPVSKGLSRKREVISIASATSRSRFEVVGILLDFWAWVDEESADGRLPGLTPASLTAIIGESDDAFWTAVVSAGWLVNRSTGLEVPNFQRWLGQSAKRRLKDTERKQTVRKLSASETDKNGTTAQHSTTQHKKNKDPPNPPRGESVSFPPELDSPDFRAAWEEWIAHRRGLRLKPYTAQGQKGIFSKLAKWGSERAVAAIQHSMAQNYQGIFEEKVSASGSSKPSSSMGERMERIDRQRKERECPTPTPHGPNDTPPPLG